MPWNAIAGLLGSVFNYSANADNNEAIAKENEYNRWFAHNEAELAHGRQLEIMDKQNQWNSYKNQRKLLEEAGYNPNALFNSSSTLSASSGASGGAQAASPSSGFPKASLLDPQILNAFADINLKNSQANKNNADTNKVNSETIGQNLENRLKSVQVKVQEKYGMLEKEFDLNLKDSERAFKDAQRLLVNASTSIAWNDLYVMKPLEASNYIADNLLKSSQSKLNSCIAAKTDKERELLTEQFALQQLVSFSVIASNYADARLTNINADNWSPNGILYKGQDLSNQLSELDYNKKSRIVDGLLDTYIESLKQTLQANNLYSSRLRDMLESPKFFDFMKILSVVPGSNSASALQPPAIQSLFGTQ